MKRLQITEYCLKSSKCRPQGSPLRFVFISDLHNVYDGEQKEWFLRTVKAQQPELIVIGGDQIVAKPGHVLEPGLEIVSRLAEEYPLYYACGNHEYRLKLYPETYGSMYTEFREKLAKTKAVYLENETAIFEKNGWRLQFLGYEMDRTYYKRFSRKELPRTELTDVFGEPEAAAFTILLAHHPAYAKTYESYGADLTLSGHYHGGVMRFRKRGAVSPDFRVFPKNCQGCYEKDGKFRIISAGCGEHTIPFRFHNPRELVVITLEPQESEPAGTGCDRA